MYARSVITATLHTTPLCSVTSTNDQTCALSLHVTAISKAVRITSYSSTMYVNAAAAAATNNISDYHHHHVY